jgi:hypothetical protein
MGNNPLEDLMGKVLFSAIVVCGMFPALLSAQDKVVE